MRLQKYLAECGVASRRACEKYIGDGRVLVNGEVASLGAKVDPATDTITLDGEPVAAAAKKTYIVLNKPEGYVTTAKDTHGRRTVFHCLDGVEARVFPVGRLDMDVEGVLLLTDDGEMAHRLLHPAYEVDKVYLAWVRGCVEDTAVQQLETGVMLEDGMTAPARAKVVKRGPHATLLRLTLREGRKREVKRMCKATGHPVRSLFRAAFGNLQSRGLRPGEWRYLSEHEVRQLRKLARL